MRLHDIPRPATVLPDWILGAIGYFMHGNPGVRFQIYRTPGGRLRARIIYAWGTGGYITQKDGRWYANTARVRGYPPLTADDPRITFHRSARP